jgi:hypothetical protein
MPWLISLLPILWRFLKHFGVYILLAAVLVGGPYLLYRKGFNDGYKGRICPPTYSVGDGGVVNNHYNADDYKLLGVKFKCLFLKLQFGY